MPNYYVIRTTAEYPEWIWHEIQAGRLRQGWGLSNMELPADPSVPQQVDDWCTRYIKQGEREWGTSIPQGHALDRLNILRPMRNIVEGDRIVVPKMPTFDAFCIVTAAGGYIFDGETPTPTELDDFHHIIPVAEEKVFHHEDGATAQGVYEMLPPYRKAVNVVRNADLKSAIDDLLK